MPGKQELNSLIEEILSIELKEEKYALNQRRLVSAIPATSHNTDSIAFSKKIYEAAKVAEIKIEERRSTLETLDKHELEKILSDAAPKKGSSLPPSIQKRLDRIFEKSRENRTLKLRSPTFQKFESQLNRARELYPGWSESQRKVQKTGNLNEWLKEEIGCNTRNAAFIATILQEELEQ